MNVSLAEMTSAELIEWLAFSLEDYISDLITSGKSPDVARETASASYADMFPGGALRSGHVVRKTTLPTGETIGHVWLGPELKGDSTAWWVWDIAVVEQYRSAGFGRQIMELAEEEVTARGGKTLGLHVFGFNKIARSLYESMGFETTSIRMSKDLARAHQ